MSIVNTYNCRLYSAEADLGFIKGKIMIKLRQYCIAGKILNVRNFENQLRLCISKITFSKMTDHVVFQV